MRILLINSVLGSDYSAMDIGITALASYVNERSNHQAAIADLVFHRRYWKQHLMNEIKEFDPQWIAMSTNTMYMQYVRTVARFIKETTKLPVLLGGHHASVYPDSCMDIADALCIGDGEHRLTQFLDQHGNIDDIPGFWDHYTHNPGGSFIEDVDDLPYLDWTLWKDIGNYMYALNMVYQICSRGCPYSCSFCDILAIRDAVHGKFFRMMSPERSAEELAWQAKRMKKYHPGLFQLFDPVFTVNRRWLEKFCKRYRQLGVPLRYSCFSRIDNLDQDRVQLLSESGCAVVRVGIESGNEYIRNEVYGKKISNDQIREVAALCKRYKIAITSYYIMGGPGETRATLKDSLDMAWELDAERTAFFVYKPFTPGAQALLAEHGGYVDTARWERANNISFGAVVNTGGVSPKVVELYQKWAYFKTFGRRWLRTIRRDRIEYFTNLLRYMTRGLRHGLDVRYLLIYFHLYFGRNVDS